MLKKAYPKISVDRLRQLFIYDPLSGALTWRIDKGRAKAGMSVGSVDSGGRLRTELSGAITMPNNVLTLNVGQSSVGTITPLLADGVTPSGGTVSAASFSIPTDTSFAAVDNGDGTLTVTGTAVSAAPVTGTASSTITDSDGAVSTFSTSFTITVAAGTTPPPVATTTSIAVAFSTPA